MDLGKQGRCLVSAGGVLGLILVACESPLPETIVEPTTGMELVLVRPDTFRMGLLRPPGDVRPAPPHEVVITRPFYFGRFEVTQRQWARVMETEPSQFSDCGPDCPVESVSWHDAQAFLTRLSEADDGVRYRLPTESEWELVCRAGGEGRYTDGLGLLSPELANYDPSIPFEGSTGSDGRGTPLPVGSFPANAWGVHDIHGNVYEWTQDEYCPYPAGRVVDPSGSCGSDSVAIRGGSWLFSANAARCGRRYTHARDDSGFSLGFRVVREVPEGFP